MHLSKKEVRKREWKKTLATFKNPFVSIVFVIFVLYSVTLIYALYWGFATSLKTRSDFVLNIFGFPKTINVANYIIAWKKLYITLGTMEKVYLPGLFWNSLKYAGGLAIIDVFSTAICAYVVNKYKCAFTKFIYNLVIVMMTVPIVNSLGANIAYAKMMGTYDNLIRVYIQHVSFLSGNFLVSYAMFTGISGAYAESAFIDGAGHWEVVFKIILPLVRVPLAVLLVLQFNSHWNDFMGPLIFLPSMPTAATGLYHLQWNTDNLVSSVPVQMAAAMLVCSPCLVIFLLMKDQMVGNLQMGGLKG